MELTCSFARTDFCRRSSADDFELIRPHLRTADLLLDTVLVRAGEPLQTSLFAPRGVISLIVNMATGEHVQIAMIGRDSIFGVFSSLGDPVALTSAVVLVPRHRLDDRPRTAACGSRSERHAPLA